MNKINKLKNRIIAIIGIIFMGIFIIALCILYRFYEIKQEEMQNKRLQVIDMYMGVLEEALDNCEKLISIQCMDNVFIQNILQPENNTARYVALEEKGNALKEEIPRCHFLDGLFVYDSVQNQYLGIKGDSAVSEDHIYIQEHIQDIIRQHDERNAKEEWFPIKINADYCLFFVIDVRGIYFGAWMLPDNMIADLQDTAVLPEEYYYIGNAKGMILNNNKIVLDYWTSATEQKMFSKGYDCVYEKSEEKKFFLLRLAKEENKGLIMSHMILPFLLMLIVLVFLYITVILITKRVVWNPVESYFIEEELKKQKVELQFLQIQISPHFLNNCLSLIRNLIFLGRYDDAENTIVMLSRYTRGSFDIRTEISLEEEIEQVKAYCDLQKLRFRNQLSVELNIDRELYSCMVPTMIVQGFVSNAVKHQMRPETVLRVTVSVQKDRNNQLHITIMDSGTGFSKTILESLKKGEAIIDTDGLSHIGISNITQRLHILYGNAADIQFQNGTEEGTGAVIMIKLPVKYSVQK